ncbi:MAG: hypothetical protein Kow0059_22770 [Candidatus Sumerlaeia bacterium]
MLDNGEWVRGAFLCAFCARENTLIINPSAGRRQTFRETCEHCHQPNVIVATVRPGEHEAHLESRCGDAPPGGSP